MKTHLDLFSGIGGFALAAKWAGYTTVGFCEIDPFARAVLAKNFPGVPIHDDVRTFPVESVSRRRIDLLSGGFPCQPFSVAGERRGDEDDRHLWPEMARLIAAVRPRWVLGENVPGFIRLGLDACLVDLEGLGYTGWPVVVPACAVGAWHRRDRVWIIAHDDTEETRAAQTGDEDHAPDPQGLPEREPANPGQSLPNGRLPRHESVRTRPRPAANPTQGRIRRRQSPRSPGQSPRLGERPAADPAPELLDGSGHTGETGRTQPANGGPPPADPDGDDGASLGYGRAGPLGCAASQAESRGNALPVEDWWALESGLRGIPDGLSFGLDPGRPDRLRALGNAIVPQVAYALIQMIVRIDDGEKVD